MKTALQTILATTEPYQDFKAIDLSHYGKIFERLGFHLKTTEYKSMFSAEPDDQAWIYKRNPLLCAFIYGGVDEEFGDQGAPGISVDIAGLRLVTHEDQASVAMVTADVKNAIHLVDDLEHRWDTSDNHLVAIVHRWFPGVPEHAVLLTNRDHVGGPTGRLVTALHDCIKAGGRVPRACLRSM